MQRIHSKINLKSDDYKAYYEHNCRLLETLAERQKTVRTAGQRGNQLTLERGKIPARERVELLLDSDTPFLELSTLAAWGIYDYETPGSGVITGIGIVGGVECMISASNPA